MPTYCSILQRVTPKLAVARQLYTQSKLFRDSSCLFSFSKIVKKRMLGSSFLSVCPSLRSHGTSRLSPDWFSWNLIFEYFSKIFREDSSIIKMRHNEYFTCRTIYIFIIFPSVFLECKEFQIIVEKIKTHFMVNNFFFLKSCYLWDNVETYCRAGQATGDSVAHAHCIPDT
jgi:hypothetical protein